MAEHLSERFTNWTKQNLLYIGIGGIALLSMNAAVSYTLYKINKGEIERLTRENSIIKSEIHRDFTQVRDGVSNQLAVFRNQTSGDITHLRDEIKSFRVEVSASLGRLTGIMLQNARK